MSRFDEILPCPNLYNNYKGNRTDNFEGGPFFKLVYSEDLFADGNFGTILEEDTLEADDCIAITTRYIIETYPEVFDSQA